MATSIDERLSFDQVVNDFLNLLLDEGGMNDVTPEIRAEMMKSLQVRLNERLFATLIANLPEEKVTELRELLEQGGLQNEAAQKFIEENTENSSELFAAAFMTFRNDYLGLNG